VLHPITFHAAQESHEYPGTGSSERMAQSDGATVCVHDFFIETD
jgi:hypothetical protein